MLNSSPGFIPGVTITMDYTPDEMEKILNLLKSDRFEGQSQSSLIQDISPNVRSYSDIEDWP